MALGLLAGVVVFLAGAVVTFLGTGLRGRAVGLAGMATGAAVTLVAAPPRPTWPLAVATAGTLVPLLLVAVGLRRRLEAGARDRAVTLDDDPR